MPRPTLRERRQAIGERFRVCRYRLYETLGLQSDTIPALLSDTLHNVPLKNRWNGLIGYYTVTIKPSEKGSYARHRIFVQCSCGKSVPYGRLNQHKYACPSEWEEK